MEDEHSTRNCCQFGLMFMASPLIEFVFLGKVVEHKSSTCNISSLENAMLPVKRGMDRAEEFRRTRPQHRNHGYSMKTLFKQDTCNHNLIKHQNQPPTNKNFLESPQGFFQNFSNPSSTSSHITDLGSVCFGFPTRANIKSKFEFNKVSSCYKREFLSR
jgi:hypothetical protein